jgi:hypothetical protein
VNPAQTAGTAPLEFQALRSDASFNRRMVLFSGNRRVLALISIARLDSPTLPLGASAHRGDSFITAATKTLERKVSAPIAAMVQAKPTIAASKPTVSAPMAWPGSRQNR